MRECNNGWLENTSACGPDVRVQNTGRWTGGELCRHGEYSGKDYEAIISKAVLLKPLARHLASYPNIYQVNTTCAEVRQLDGHPPLPRMPCRLSRCPISKCACPGAVVLCMHPAQPLCVVGMCMLLCRGLQVPPKRLSMTRHTADQLSWLSNPIDSKDACHAIRVTSPLRRLYTVLSRACSPAG